MAVQFVQNNMEYILLLVFALVGVSLMKNNAFGVNDWLVSRLPVNATTANSGVQILAAVLFGWLGYMVGMRIKGERGEGMFNAHTYEAYDKLLPEDYYGIGGRMASPIDFSNNPPPL